jgi:hypothetical protein
MQSNSEYLTLALYVRKLTDSLIRLVENGTPGEELNGSIQEVVASLEGAGTKISVKALRERGPFGRYASTRAIDEVVGPRRQDLITKLNSVMNPQSPAQQTESALDAIRFFDVLERRALYHYNRAQAQKNLILSR